VVRKQEVMSYIPLYYLRNKIKIKEKKMRNQNKIDKIKRKSK